MKTNIKVSVLMLTYNQSKYIDEALAGVLHQCTNFDFEVVIGDDCSTDDTVKHILEWREKYPDKLNILLSTNNQGLLPNFIRTFNSCRGEYIAICEGDDYWTDKNKLQYQVDFLDKNINYSTCIHRVVNYYEETDTKSLSNGGQKAHNNILDLAKSNFITNVSAMFRATRVDNLPEWFKNVGTYDYAIHMLNATDGDIYYMARPMAVYRKHSGAIWSKNKASAQLLLSMQVREQLLQYFKKYRKDVFETLSLPYLACGCALMRLYKLEQNESEASRLVERMRMYLPNVTTEEIEKLCSKRPPEKGVLKKILSMMRSNISKLIPVPKPA